MIIECPRCGYCGDEDEFEEHDYLAEHIEDARVDAEIIQGHVMARRVNHAVAILSDLIGRLERQLRDLPQEQRRRAERDDIGVELREASPALSDGQHAEAICLLERFIDPSPAATVTTVREMQRYVTP